MDQVTLGSGQTQASFYVRGTQAGAVDLNVTPAAGYGSPTAQAHTVTPGVPDGVVAVNPPTALDTGVCTAVVLVLVDAFGNPTNAISTLSVSGEGGALNVTLHADPACAGGTGAEFAIGASMLTVYVRAAAPGTGNIVVDVTDESAGSMLTPATLPVTVAPPLLALQPQGGSVDVDRCRRVNVLSQTATGTSWQANGDVVVSVSSATAGLYLDACCRTPAATVLIADGNSTAIMYASASVAGTHQISATATDYAATSNAVVFTPPPAQNAWWDPAWCRRIPVAVQSLGGGALGSIPAEYSLPVDVDHQGMVTALTSLSNGDDLRVLGFDGTAWQELDRVLDAGSSFNGNPTQIWFQLPQTISNGSRTRYFVYYDNPLAGVPPANPQQVFLFYEGFEANNLNNWDTWVAGNMDVSSNQAHGGVRSLRARQLAIGIGERFILANGSFPADTYVDGWWWLSRADLNVGMDVRASRGGLAGVELSGYDARNAAGLQLNRYVNNARTQIAAPAGATAAVGQWSRVAISVTGTSLRGYQGTTQVVPVTGVTTDTTFSTGSPAFRFNNTADGDEAYVDDVVVRRFQFPEPVTSLEAVQAR